MTKIEVLEFIKDCFVNSVPVQIRINRQSIELIFDNDQSVSIESAFAVNMLPSESAVFDLERAKDLIHVLDKKLINAQSFDTYLSLSFSDNIILNILIEGVQESFVISTNSETLVL